MFNHCSCQGKQHILLSYFRNLSIEQDGNGTQTYLSKSWHPSIVLIMKIKGDLPLFFLNKLTSVSEIDTHVKGKMCAANPLKIKMQKNRGNSELK